MLSAPIIGERDLTGQDLFVRGLRGLGDNIYQRAFVTAYGGRGNVCIDTPWPEVYSDLPHVSFVRPNTTLRTQAKNVARQKASIWMPSYGSPVHISYSSRGLATQSIMGCMQDCFGFAPGPLSLPFFDVPTPIASPNKPLAVVRPVTVRTEWRNEARNPDPQYIEDACEALMDLGFHVVLIADTDGANEWIVGNIPYHDQAFIYGELSVEQALNAVAMADICVGGVGWMVPASIAHNTPMIVIGGGCLANNNPAVVGTSAKTSWILPDNPCYCAEHLHKCDKHISDFYDKVEFAINALVL